MFPLNNTSVPLSGLFGLNFFFFFSIKVTLRRVVPFEQLMYPVTECAGREAEFFSSISEGIQVFTARNGDECAEPSAGKSFGRCFSVVPKLCLVRMQCTTQYHNVLTAL